MAFLAGESGERKEHAMGYYCVHFCAQKITTICIRKRKEVKKRLPNDGVLHVQKVSDSCPGVQDKAERCMHPARCGLTEADIN